MKNILCLLAAILFSITVNSQNAKKYYHTGEEFVKAGNFKDAIVQFTSAIDMNPNYKDAYFLRGTCFESINEYQKAADDFNRAIVFEPKNEELYYHLGVDYYKLHQYPEALVKLHRATQLSHKFVMAYQQKILVMIALDQSFNALKVCDSALNIESNAKNYYLQGVVIEKLNSLQKAEVAYNKSIKEDKKFIDAYIALALLQINLNKPEEAMNNCMIAYKLDPNSKPALVARSKVFLKKQDYRNAIDDISRAIVLNPTDEDMFFTRGLYYQQFSQYQNAINDFNKVISINPKNADALYKRANSYEEISDFKSAIRDYQALALLSDDDAKAKSLLKKSQERLFELNRENNNPVIVLQTPTPKNKFILELPTNKSIVHVQGTVTDQSEVIFVKVNNQDLVFKKVNDEYEFSGDVKLDSSGVVSITSSDIYKNVEKMNFSIKRTETDPPKVSIVAPFASDNGEIYIDTNDPGLYIEGKITDESLVKSILIEGVSASFKLDDLNPTFSANIDINNKNKFSVVATDIYGNEKSYTFTLNREGASINGGNPMGKTWVIFVENSNYRTFASLEGPVKDVSLMKAALSKYQVHNIIHKKDMTKEQMEKFFSIELRDLIRSNRVNTLLVWYAGHGKFINETGYWIPIDANRDDEYTYFNINFLKASLQSYATLLNHTLVITDACESGPTFFQAMRSAIKERSCDDWQATRLKSSQVFSSAGYELAQDNSQFTKTFANLLASNPNACIPIESIVLKVSSTIAQPNQQKPKFGKISGLTDEDGTFFFMAKGSK